MNTSKSSFLLTLRGLQQRLDLLDEVLDGAGGALQLLLVRVQRVPEEGRVLQARSELQREQAHLGGLEGWWPGKGGGCGGGGPLSQARWWWWYRRLRRRRGDTISSLHCKAFKAQTV